MKQVCFLSFFFLVASCQAPPPNPPANSESTGILEGITTGKTKIVDLGHALNSKNPYWPGPGYEPFKFEIFATIEKDHVLSGRMTLAEHTGTHLDAPNHFVNGQVSVENIPLTQLFGPSVVIDVRTAVASSPDYLLTTSDITTFEQQHGKIPDNAVVFMYTGWDERWDDYDKYKNADTRKVLHFPGFSTDAAKLLAEERHIAGIGIDTLSVDYGMSTDFMVHHISHGKGKFHLENVANLGAMPATGGFVIVAPMKIENGTGGPARIFGLIKQ
jgi:kynurenine formamidase